MFDFNNIDLETLKKMRECIINYSDISSLLLDIDNSISEKEEEIYNIVYVVLKVNNGALETTHLTKEWQKKYIYIYKIEKYYNFK